MKPKYCTDCKHCIEEPASGSDKVNIAHVGEHWVEQRDWNYWCGHPDQIQGAVFIASVYDQDELFAPPIWCPFRVSMSINFLGSAGQGKSTLAGASWVELKRKRVSTELVPEWIKNEVWKENYKIMEDQGFIFANQAHMLKMLNGKVDVLLTDSPQLLNLFYGRYEPLSFEPYVLDTYNQFVNINFVVERGEDISYVPEGRVQSEKESWECHERIMDILKRNKIPYVKLERTADNHYELVQQVLDEIKRVAGQYPNDFEDVYMKL
jgi:nicotinamide riboside kinase